MIERWWVLILWGTGHFFPSLLLSLKVAQAGSKPGIILFSFISSHKQHHRLFGYWATISFLWIFSAVKRSLTERQHYKKWFQRWMLKSKP